jgi:hypothetical protein
MLSRLTLAALFLAVAISGASGLAAMIGDAFVKLPAPAGFCELAGRYEFDARTESMAAALLNGAGVRLLAISADCDQLTEAREGKRRQLDDIVQYEIENVDQKWPPALPISQRCKNVRNLSNYPFGIDARLASTIQNKFGDAAPIGVIGEDKNACYSGALQKTVTETGTQRVLVSLNATTTVGNRAIVVSRYAVYQNQDTINALLPKLQGDVAALIAANPSN